jgi:hypothetical protein
MKFLAILLLFTAACAPSLECERDDDCGNDVCDAGACVECATDRDCADDEQCDDGTCERASGEALNVAPLSLADRTCARWAECGVPPPEEGSCEDQLQELIDNVGSVDVTLCDELGFALRDALECETTAPCAAIEDGSECPEEWEEINELFDDGAGACMDGEEPAGEDPEEDDVPAGWQCEPSYYGDGDCDCGCGVIDTDCDGGGVDACDFCFDDGEPVSCEVDEPDCDVSAFANPTGNGSLSIDDATVSVSDDNFAECPVATQMVFLSVSGVLQADLSGDEVSVSSAGNTPFSCSFPSFVDGILACVICGGASASSTLAAQLIDDAGARTDAVCVLPE